MATKETKEVAPKVERERKNGFTKPAEGTTTRLVWDIADEISAKLKRPAKRDEVFAEFTKRLGDKASAGTCGTQYSRWSGFHDVGPVLKKLRAEEKAAADAEKQKEKDARVAERAEAKALKEKEKAEAAQKRADAKAEKERLAKEKADARDAAAAEKAKAAAAAKKKK